MYEEKVGFKDVLVAALWVALAPFVVNLLITTPYSFIVGFNTRGDQQAIQDAVIALGTSPIYAIFLFAVLGLVAFWRARKLAQKVYEGQLSEDKKRIAWITLIPVPQTIFQGLAAAALGVVIQTIIALVMWLPPNTDETQWTMALVRLGVALVGAYIGGYMVYNQNKAAHEKAETEA